MMKNSKGPKGVKKEKIIPVKEPVNEFRRDLVDRDWVLVSSARLSRPHFGVKKDSTGDILVPAKECPFEDPQKSGNGEPLYWLPRPSSKSKKIDSEKFENWFVQVIQNKYPAVFKNIESDYADYGPFKKWGGFGYHEVVITRDHDRPLQKMETKEISLVFKTYQERYKILEKDERIDYILIYHNQGELAGASIPHPHSQIVAMPIVPPEISRSINGGILFYEKNQQCVYCAMLKFELKEKIRVVFENECFVVIAPYASKVPYELRIFPKKHSSNFEDITDNCLDHLSEALKDGLVRLEKVLGDFDYNFFIHTSSARIKNVPYYHWHIEIYPRTYKWAGLELGSGIDVLAVPPEQAAEELRKALKKRK
jgi:UDPglucose--hexose-1-phosphate uridylyltransferase